MMRTRSQVSVEIDFDEASKYWNANKRRVGNAPIYEYVCGAICKNGQFCQKRPVKNDRHCIIHQKTI